MVSFVHIADIHVGMGFGSASFSKEIGNERRREIKETLFRVVDYCESEGTDLLLIAGDLFEDDYVSISDLKDMNHKFSTLTATKVCIGAGNHDPVIDGNSCYNLIRWCENVHLFGTSMDSILAVNDQVKVHSFSWDQKYLEAFTTDTINILDKDVHHILMLHGDVYTKNDYLYIDPTLVEPLGFDYIALGHIHKMDFVRANMAYPGSPEPMDFSETGEHGFIEGEIDSNGLRATFVPFSKREFRVVEVQVDGKKAFEAVKESVKEVLQKMPKEDLYRVRLIGLLDSEIELDLGELKSSLQGTVHYIEIINKTMPDLNIEQLRSDYAGTLIGAYIDYMNGLDDDAELVSSALYEGLLILLREQVI